MSEGSKTDVPESAGLEWDHVINHQRSDDGSADQIRTTTCIRMVWHAVSGQLKGLKLLKKEYVNEDADNQKDNHELQ
jgi:hypothetical protein